MKTRFAYFMDNMFIFIILFILIELWTITIIKTWYISIIISLTLSMAITKIIFSETKIKREKKLTTIKDKKEAERILSHFLKITNDKIIDNIKLALDKSYITPKKTNYIMIVKKRDNNSDNIQNSTIFHGGMTVIIPLFHTESVTLDKIDSIIKIKAIKNARKIIVAASFSPSSIDFSKHNNDIILLTHTEFYLELKKENLFIDIPENTRHVSLNFVISSSLNKTKTRKYLLSSVFLLIGSFILPYSIYYKIVASILLVFAIISFFISPAKKMA